MKLSFFLLLLSLLTLAQSTPPAARRRSRARAFIELQCQKTLYPDLCTRSLSYYVADFAASLSHQKLAQLALGVSLARAESTQSYVTEVARGLRGSGRDYRAVKECLDQINDGVEQLSNSIKEIRQIKEDGETSDDFPWHASNVKTWMSAAMTDASSCIDGISGRAIGGKTKAVIKAKVLNLEQVTSNALALFNRFAARYRSAHARKP